MIPDTEGEDGNGKSGESCRDDLFGNKAEKIPKTELGAMTPSSGSVAAESSGAVDQDGAEGSPRSVQDVEGRTVTCCLFKDRDHSELQGPREPGSCHLALRGLGQRDSPQEALQEAAMPLTVLEQELKSATYSLLKRLKEKALDTLLEAVESRGGMPSDCVMVSRTELRLGGHVASPQLLVCKLYRWSDLQHPAQLKPLCECRSFGALDSPTVCCNPYHYSRLCGPGKALCATTTLVLSCLFFPA